MKHPHLFREIPDLRLVVLTRNDEAQMASDFLGEWQAALPGFLEAHGDALVRTLSFEGIVEHPYWAAQYLADFASGRVARAARLVRPERKSDAP